jgi:hypothetical protein
MRRISLSLVLLLACSLLLAACGSKSKSKNSSSSSGGSSSISGAEIAPASAIGFLSISTDSSGTQWQQAKKLIAGIPAAQKALDKALSDSGVTLTDVEQALGKTTILVELGTAAKSVTVVLTDTTDAAKLKSILAKSKSKKKLVTAEIGSWLAVSDSQAALDQYQSAAATGKLADGSTFKQALEGVPTDALVKAYLTGDAITASAGTLGGSGSASKALGSAAAKNQLEWGTLAASAVPEGLSVSGTFKGKSALTNSSSSLIGELPSGTAFAIDLNGTTVGLKKAVLDLRNNTKYGSQVPQIEAALGVKLEDLAALVGSEMSIYGSGSGIGLLFKAPNPAQSKAMLDKAIKLFSAQLSGASKTVSVGGVQATELTLGKMKIYYGVKDDNLFIVTNANALPGAGKLSSDPVYSAAAKALSVPASNVAVAFIDFAQLAQLAKSSDSVVKGLGSLGGASTTQMGSGFDPRGVSALLGYIVANGDKVELKAMLSVK